MYQNYYNTMIKKKKKTTQMRSGQRSQIDFQRSLTHDEKTREKMLQHHY